MTTLLFKTDVNTCDINNNKQIIYASKTLVTIQANTNINYDEVCLSIYVICVINFSHYIKSVLSSIIYKQVMNMFWPVKTIDESNSIHQL